jgi:hypothetical protein
VQAAAAMVLAGENVQVAIPIYKGPEVRAHTVDGSATEQQRGEGHELRGRESAWAPGNRQAGRNS